ncbi:hypothetical protein [Actinomadura sp. BRA 177]|uniref:hypothetical protein n=1 Tax=Actinomadura sp. BRA 177 TaxID=2745202 RepID=UPI001596129A|nr:hypothetical protein [Actinomadura sp. BRA 177]NVI88468.1 hypothetical protein [Actinomadura sp. BRA 177]
MTQQVPESGNGPGLKITEGQPSRSATGSEKLKSLGREALRGRTVQYFAYYVRGNQLFWQDTFDSDDEPGIESPDDAKRKREWVHATGQRLNYVVARLDKAFSPVQSGRLIRCVFDVGDGAVFYHSPFFGEYLVGAVLADTPVDVADATMGQLCDRVRLIRGYGGHLNLAGADTEYDVDVDEADLAEDEPYIDEFGLNGSRPELSGHFRSALSAEALHYVMYLEGAEPIRSADLLRHPRLEPLTVGTDHDARRKHYERIGKLTYITSHRMDRTLLPLLGGVLRRVVLDVEAGALYFRRLGEDDALIGVTLDQAKVAVAEASLNTLAQAIADR